MLVALVLVVLASSPPAVACDRGLYGAHLYAAEPETCAGDDPRYERMVQTFPVLRP